MPDRTLVAAAVVGGLLAAGVAGAGAFIGSGIVNAQTGNRQVTVRGLAEHLGVGASKVIHPTRVAVTGRTTGPGLFEALHVLRRDRVLARLRRAREIAEGHAQM